MSYPQTQRFLQIPELIDNVLSHILEQSFPEHEQKFPLPGSGTLLTLALTSKVFTEPALDRIWYYLIDLWPLHRFWFEQLPFPNLAQRLDYYLDKVRVFGPDADCSMNSHHQLLIPAIMRGRGENLPLFPNLKRLYMFQDDFRYFACLPRAVIGPGIQHLHLIISAYRIPLVQQPSTWRNFESIVPRIRKSLKEFKISTGWQEEYVEPLLFPALPEIHSSLCALGCLQSLRIVEAALTADLLSQFVSNTRLHTLDFTISNEEAYKFMQTTPMEASTLDRVTLRMRDLGLATKLLYHLCQPGLRHLKIIQLGTDSLLWNLRNFLTSSLMAPGGCMKDVQELEVLPKATSRNLRGLTSDTLHPILHMPNLQVLRLPLCGKVDLSFAALEKVAKACPCLRVFDCSDHPDEHIPQLTLLDIISFVSMCTSLKELRIRFNAMALSYEVADLLKSPCRQLLTLDVCLSPCVHDSRQLIDQLLFMSFPCLENLFPNGETRHGYHVEPMDMPSRDDIASVWRLVAEELSHYRKKGLFF